MSLRKFLFFLRAYPAEKRISLVMLLLAELTRLHQSIRIKLFSKTLIESRSVLGFVLKNNGSALPEKDYMLITFTFRGSVVKLRLRWDSSDFLVFEQVFIKEEYAALQKTPLVSPVIVDAGANIGCTSIYLKALYPNAQILAIEADPTNFEILQGNLELCSLRNVQCFHAALWHTNETVLLDRNFRDNRDWSIRISDQGKVPVKAQTLRSILTELQINNVDILKIDIEGAEIKIFNADATLPDVLTSVKYIAIEVHDDVQRAIENKLISLRFSLFNQGETLFGHRTNELWKS